LGQTEYMGFGVAQGLIAGSRWDLFLISAITVPSTVIGTFLGLTSGTYGGWVDRVVMMVTDAFLSVPYFVLVILVFVIALPRVPPTEGPYVFIGAMNGVMWAPFTRVVRGEASRVRTTTYVESAKASGASSGRILLHHILPNSASPALAQVPVTVALTLTFIITSQFITTAIITSGGTSCSTMGSGLSSLAPVVPRFNYPEWGGILSAGLAFTGGWLPQPDHPFGVYWWGALFPGVWIAMFGLSIVLISDGVRDWLSPKARK
jgi:peptide/nickel transport system permease protein